MLNDLHYALRGLARNPGFTLAAILTLALGIGAVTSIFSVADAVLLQPLPYPNENRLVMVWDQLTKLGQDRYPLRYETFIPYSKSGIFESTAEFNLAEPTLTGAGEPTRLLVVKASASLIPMLGATPAIGRGFTESECKPGHGNVAILSHEFFMERFGGKPDILGDSITLNGRAYTVIGVMPAGFEFSRIEDRPSVWTPLELANTGQWGLFNMIGVLRPGVSIAAAQAALDPIAKHLDQAEHMYHGPNGEDAGYRVKIVSLHDELLGRFRTATVLLLCAVAAVLLIAVVNVANLLLVRAVSREKEFAVRRALGASEARLARQWIAEAAVLTAIGGTLGAIASVWGVRLLIALSPAALPAVARIGVDSRALALAFAIVAIVSIVFGLASLGTGRSNLRGESGKKRTAPALIAAETALAMILLVSASLLIESFTSLRHVNTGFRPEHLLTMQLNLPGPRYEKDQTRIAFYSAVHDRLVQLPGVVSAGEISRLPVNCSPANTRGGNPFSIEGRPWNPNGAVPQLAHTQSADPEYFRTMQIPLLAGRVFTDADTASSPHVVVVNESLARGFFPHGALGGHIMLGAPRSGYPWLTIVGIVGDVKTACVDEPAMPQFYQPLTQDPSPFLAIVLRTSGDPAKVARAATAAVQSVDPDRPVYQVQTMEQRIAGTISQPRFETLIVGFFALAAVFLAAIGIFGVVAHSTVRRTQEIGIRMALGADAGRVLRYVIAGGMRPVLAGMLIGGAGALAVGRMLGAFLYHVRPADPVAFVVALAALALAAIAACWGPALRATRIDPMLALRSE